MNVFAPTIQFESSTVAKMSSHIPIEPDEIDDLPAYNPASSSSAPYSQTATPQPEVYGRIANIAGEVASDRRYTGGDTLDEPVSTTIVSSPFSCLPPLPLRPSYPYFCLSHHVD